MTRTQYLLARLAEELGEAAQRALKAQAWGLAEVQPGQAQSNAARLTDELDDVIGVVLMLRRDSLIPDSRGEAAFAAKAAKVEHFMELARARGMLTDGAPAKPEGGYDRDARAAVIETAAKIVEGLSTASVWEIAEAVRGLK